MKLGAALLTRLAPDPQGCRQAVDDLRRAYPGASPRELADVAIEKAKRAAAVAGAATGAASSPLTMLPAALADVAAVLRIEAHLIGTIAGLLEPSSLDDEHAMHADLTGILFPGVMSQALRQAGIKAGEKLTEAVIRKYVSEDLLRNVMRLASHYLGRQVAKEALTRKAVPFVGMGIGAGWNWLEVRAIGQRAVRYYSHQPIGPSPLSLSWLRGKSVKAFLPHVRKTNVKLLPGPSQGE